MKKKLILHMGYPKTGTSTLQLMAFPYISGAEVYVNPFVDLARDASYLTLDQLGRAHAAGVGEGEHPKQIKTKRLCELLLDLQYNRVEKNKVLRELDESIFTAKVNFLSYESMIARLLYVWKVSGLASYQTYGVSDLVENLIRPLKQKFDVKIILTLRKQPDFITSYFAQAFYIYKQEKYNYPFKTFHEYWELFLMPDSLFNKALSYYSIVQAIEGCLGKENIYVDLFESFKADNKLFIKRMLDFAGLKIKASVLNDIGHLNKRMLASGGREINRPSLLQWAYNIKKRYLPNTHLHIGCFVEKLNFLSKTKIPSKTINHTICLNEADQKRILSVFELENRQLAHYYGLSMGQYGYFSEVENCEAIPAGAS